VSAETLASRYIRFLFETSFHVTFRGYLPRNRALAVLLPISAKLGQRLGEACIRLQKRCFSTSDDELHANGEQEEPEHTIDHLG
jgi:hypothetical protein